MSGFKKSSVDKDHVRYTRGDGRVSVTYKVNDGIGANKHVETTRHHKDGTSTSKPSYGSKKR